MSRGLGKIQRQILELLLDTKDWEEVTMLTRYIFHPDADDMEFTQSEYMSVYRAVNTLETRGLIETRVRDVTEWRDCWGRGGPNSLKEARLSVNANAVETNT